MKFEVYDTGDELHEVEADRFMIDGSSISFYDGKTYTDDDFIISFTNYISCERIKEPVPAVVPISAPKAKIFAELFETIEPPIRPSTRTYNW